MHDDDLRLHCLRRLHRGLAHEMRAPFNAAGLHLTLLRRAAKGDMRDLPEVGERQLEWLDSVDRDLARLHDKMELLLGALGPPAPCSEPKVVGLREVVEELDELVRPEAYRRSIQVENDLAEVEVRARRQELTDGILALFVVALEATERGATLRVGTSSANGQARLQIAVSPRDVAPTRGSALEQSAETGREEPDLLEAARRLLKEEHGSVSAERRQGGALALQVRFPAVQREER